MTKSTYWGAQGGLERWVAPSLADHLEEGELVRATCACPFAAQYVEPEKIGRKCGLCGSRLDRA